MDQTLDFLRYIQKESVISFNDGKISIKDLEENWKCFSRKYSADKAKLKVNNILQLLQKYNFVQCSFEDFIVIDTKYFRRAYVNNIDSRIRKNCVKNDLSDNIYSLCENMEKKMSLLNEAPEQSIEFHSCGQTIDKSFLATSLGCYFCSKNFKSKSEYKDDVRAHKTQCTNPENVSINDRKWEISYYIVEQSNNLLFKISSFQNTNIQRIIFINDEFVYVNRNEMPVKLSKGDTYEFCIDRNILKINELCPFTIIFDNVVYTYNFLRQISYPTSEYILTSLKFPERACLIAKAKLPKIKIPNILKDINILDEKVIKEYLSSKTPNLRSFFETNTLTKKNFETVVNTLLTVEDTCLNRKYAHLSVKNVNIKGQAGSYVVEVNKSNNRNDVFVEFMDTINIKDNLKDDQQTFSGDITDIVGRKVYFSLRKTYTFTTGPDFDVSFTPSRYQIIMCYNAFNMLNKSIIMYLLPDRISLTKTPIIEDINSSIKFEYYHNSVKNNVEQKQAVEQIVSGSWTNYCPYILFGPPGTGKTTTLVESILQTLKIHGESRIFVTAPSNAACDEITTRLKKYLVTEKSYEPIMIRLYSNAFAEQISDLDNDFYEISNLCHGVPVLPSVEVLLSYRVIIATPCLISKYVLNKFPSTFFTHIFFDENASCSIHDALMAICGLWTPKTRLILAGDPKQLGPIFNFRGIENMGLPLSLMEEVMKCPVYNVDVNGCYDKTVQTRLNKNFRCHPKILNLFNKLCYGNLQACADKSKINKALDWNYLKNKNVPIIFHENFTPSERKINEFSWSNAGEVNVVMSYIKDLMILGLNKHNVLQTDIGVVTPYKKQCGLIEDELAKRYWDRIEVGSAEKFQGKEKMIIIVSMVRSETPTLGFLDNIRRLNVIISRAEALLVIIGNPKTLEQETHLRTVIDICRSEGTFVNDSNI